MGHQSERGSAGLSLSVQIVERVEEMEALREPWDRLLGSHRGPNPFLSFAWAETWLATVGREVVPFVLVVREAERIQAIAPFCIQDGGLLSFIGYPQSDYADLLVDPQAPAAVAEIVAALQRQRGRWRRICLDQMHEERSHWRELAAAFDGSGLPHRLEVGDYCPAMSLEDRAAAKKKYYKKNIANYVNWFKRQGDFACEHYAQLEPALARLEDLFAQHVERWHGTPTPSSFLRPEMQEFYRRFVRALLPSGAVQFFALRLDEEFLAFFLCFEQDGTLYLYKPSYNQRYYRHSPGQAILRFLFDYAEERGLMELDFGRGDEGYKDRFSNLGRRNRRILVYANPLARGAAELRHRLRHSRPVEKLLARPAVRGWIERRRG